MERVVVNLETKEASVVQMSDEEAAAFVASSKGQREVEVRAKRDALLSECDWTQVADAPVDQAAWAAYRQALRDIPAQAGFPENVVWPEQPA